MTDIIETMACRSCSSNDLTFILDLGNQAWGNDFKKTSLNEICKKYPLEFYVCKNCMLAQTASTRASMWIP